MMPSRELSNLRVGIATPQILKTNSFFLLIHCIQGDYFIYNSLIIAIN